MSTGHGWLDFIIVMSAALAAAGVILRFVWSIVRLLRKVDGFLLQWFGSSDKDGMQIPGVMDRLQEIENQLKPNGGLSLRDRVDSIEQALVEKEDQKENNADGNAD